MTTVEAGQWVWMPSDEDGYLPTKVVANFKRGEKATVESEDGEQYEVSAKLTPDLMTLDPECLVNTDNLVKLNDLNEAVILHILRMRFKKDQIYTYVSSILIAVNPFRMLPIYTPEVLDSYKEGNVRDLPPHVFAIADNSYKSMLGDARDQAVVISGESGAGKTETMKLVLQYLAEVSGRAAVKKDGETEGLEQQILKANPVMEAFGNAKTLRNNNSSRFGKWTEVKFNRGGSIVGGSITNYLLEKSRLPHQAEGERNYHIFYNLIAGGKADKALMTELSLKDPEDYHYLNQSGVTTVDTINDEKDYEELTNAMDILNIPKADVMRLVAALLHVGNVAFDPAKDDGSKVKDFSVVELAAKQLGVAAKDLEKCLTFKNIGTRSIIFVAYSTEQAAEARDAMTKAVYGKLFDWLILKINESLGKGIGDGAADAAGQQRLIGVLDIFGFESFETNSFEQLCINFCNEKLQFHFNEHIFRLEQEEYASEGISVDNIDFADNKPCLDLLQAKGTGVFSMIDEEISVPKGSDDGFLRKVLTNHAKHPNMKKPRPKDKDARQVFIIVHYAGAVHYNSTNFLEKNKDAIHGDITAVIQSTDFDLLKALYAPPPSAAAAAEEEKPKKAARGRSKRRKPGRKQPTLGTQFKKQLESLMKTLNSTDPHFIRCMKPNHVKKGKIFEAPMMLAQLRYAGLLEVCRIRQIGYPVRKPFEDFHFRYKCLELKSKDHTELLASLTKAGTIQDVNWAVGKNKVFMRNVTQLNLETAREEALSSVVTLIEKNIRRWLMKLRYRRFHEIRVGLREAVASRDESKLDHWLSMCAELPWAGRHLDDVKAGRALKERLVEEARVTELLREAISARDLAQVVSALKAAADMGLSCPEVKEAQGLQQRIEEERKVLAELKAAASAKDKDKLNALLDRAEELELEDTDEYRQATATRQRIEEEEEAIGELRAAIEAQNLPLLSACITRIAELGLEPAELGDAQKLQTHLRAQLQARQALTAAIAARSLVDLRAALAKASSVGVAGEAEEVVAASKLAALIENEDAVIAEMGAAADTSDEGRIQKAMAEADKLKLKNRAEYHKCEQTLKRLNVEKAAVAALAAAIASGAADALEEAINGASTLGLDAPELAQARSALAKLGAQNESLAAVNDAVAAGDLAAIDAALAAAREHGMGDAAAVKAAESVRARLLEENAAAETLKAAVEAGVLEDITRALAEASRLNLGRRFAAEVTAAQAAEAALKAKRDAAAHITSATKNADAEALEAALAEAKEVGLAGDVVDAGVAELAKLRQHAELSDRLVAALEAKDKETLQALVEEAKELGMDNEHTQAALVIVDRERFIADTRAAMEAAIGADDLDALNAALQKVIEFGIEGADVDAAKAKRDELERDRELAASLVAAIKAAEVKAAGVAGVTAADVAPLEAAIAEAADNGLKDDSASMKRAAATKQRMLDMIELQATLPDLIKTATLRELRKAMDKAGDLQMESEPVRELRERIREVERERHAAAAAGEEGDFFEDEDVPNLDDEEVQAARKAQMEKAMNPRYHWTKFPALRDPDDFAKGVIFSKKKVKRNRLIFQKGVIHKSMTFQVNKKLNKIATRMHKSLLGYAGDKSMAFPATLAQDILQQGINNNELVDEIYVQVCKHLTKNPRPESARAGWQVMCMAVGTFPPSSEFENYLLNFILEQRDGAGQIGNYARYALRRLEGIMNSGSSAFVPNVEEIQAYKERPPILATIELVDGTPLTEDLPITPDLNVAKVLDICNHFMELQDTRREFFGIFVEDVQDEEAEAGAEDKIPTTPKPLQNESFMGDVVMTKTRENQPFKFVYKRKIFLRNEDETSDDPMFQRLIYLQAVDEVILSNIPLDDEDSVTELTTIAMVVDLGNEMPGDVDGLIEAELYEYIPYAWREEHDLEKWASLVLDKRDKLVAISEKVDDDGNEVGIDELQQRFVSAVHDHELYGTCFFNVRKNVFPESMADLEDDLIVAFNSDGLHFLDQNRNVRVSYGYADIYRWGGSSSQFSVIVWNAEAQDTDDVSMYTTQAADMAGLILDYINAIMAHTT